MAQESCNLDKKEEAEILKPPSSPSSSASPPPPPPPLFMNSNNTSNNSLQEFSSKKLEKPEKTIREEGPSKPPPSIRLGNRCSSCRKRVGLTGFRCRCGELFCGKHRYSDVHDCSFDYKALGRQEISKANPLVRAAKIIKI